MNPLFLLFTFAGVSIAVPSRPGGGQRKGTGGQHKGQNGHDQNCVDISRYSEVQFNASLAEFCTYQVKQQCQKHQQQVCAAVPTMTCTLESATECSQSTAGQQQVRNDQIEQRQFTPKVCQQSGTQTIDQSRQRPVCKQVTKPLHCESKWIVNDQGEKVWAGNENCQSETTEECTLETYHEPIQVPVYTCTDGAPLTYNSPLAASETVTKYSTHCKAAAKPACKTTSTKQECISVAYEECSDTIVPVCTTGQGQAGGAAAAESFQVPYQTFDHRLKCLA
jgi:hypothetical protein